MQRLRESIRFAREFMQINCISSCLVTVVSLETSTEVVGALSSKEVLTEPLFLIEKRLLFKENV